MAGWFDLTPEQRHAVVDSDPDVAEIVARNDIDRDEMLRRIGRLYPNGFSVPQPPGRPGVKPSVTPDELRSMTVQEFIAWDAQLPGDVCLPAEGVAFMQANRPDLYQVWRQMTQVDPNPPQIGGRNYLRGQATSRGLFDLDPYQRAQVVGRRNTAAGTLR